MPGGVTCAWLRIGAAATQVLLALVFLLAGLSKARNSAGLASTLRALGVGPSRLIAGLQVAVPAVEVALGVWLFTGWMATGATFVAAGILTVFTVVLLRLRQTNYEGNCACFMWDERRVDGRQVGRNVVLLALAVTAGASHYVDECSSRAAVWYLPEHVHVPAALLASLAVAVYAGVTGLLPGAFGRWRTEVPGRGAQSGREAPGGQARMPNDDLSRSRLAESDDSKAPSENGPAMDSRVPAIELTDLAGEPLILGRPGGVAQLVVFARGRCPRCQSTREVVNAFAEQNGAVETIVVCGGSLEATKEFASQVAAPVRVVADPRWRAAIAWSVSNAPFSAVVDQDGHVRSKGEPDSVAALAHLMQEIDGAAVSSGRSDQSVSIAGAARLRGGAAGGGESGGLSR